MTAELPEEPRSRKESYLAAIAGEDVVLPDAPESRTEQYLAYIAENGGGGGGGTSNFNQLTNRPKYNSTTMTGSTNIPKVPTATSELANDSGFITASALPTVNDATLTITQNGTSKGTFTANDADDTTIALTDTTYSDFTGTDGTAAGAAGLVPAPATTDAGKFLKADGTWDDAAGSTYTAGDGIDITNDVISATNTGKAKVLTSADYNWNSTLGSATEPYNSIGLGLLDYGIYSVAKNTNVSIQPTANFPTYDTLSYIIVGENPSGTATSRKVLFSRDDKVYIGSCDFITNKSAGYYYLLDQYSLTNSLTSTSTTTALTANQGKALKDLIDSLVIKNAGAPTTATVGTVGKLLEDTTNGDLYICTDASNPYVWEEVGGGGSGGASITELTSADYNYPTTGAATQVALYLLDTGIYYVKDGNTNVRLSSTHSYLDSGVYIVAPYGTSSKQITVASTSTASDGIYKVNASTGAETSAKTTAYLSDIFADPATQYKIKIGAGTSSSEGTNGVEIGRGSTANASAAVAIGSYASATGTNSAAIGYGSTATAQGEVGIGLEAAYSGLGYNSSNYRLLTGLYDGQSANDAVNVSQVNSVIDAINTALSTNIPHIGA